MRRLEHTIGSRMAGLMRSANILLLSAMSTVALLSCGGSGDEPAPDPVNPQPKGTPIVFSGSLSEGQSENHARTRATNSPLSSTHQTFHVWAYKNPATGSTETVMQNYTVNWIDGSAGSTTSNSSGWEYVNQQPANGVEQGIKYWDFTASNYRFFGYAGTVETPTYTPSSTNPTEVSLAFDVNASTADLSDLTGATLFSKLWCKTGTAIASDIKPVQLEFLQPCVKVRFLFKQSAASDEYFYKKEIEFKPTNGSKIVTGGRFSVTYPLTGNTTKESWSVETGVGIATSATIDALTQADDAPSPAVPVLDDGVWYKVLPALDQGSYTLSVTINNEPEPRTVIVPQQYMNWQPGFEYTYIFKITDSGGITFDGLEVVKITPWATDEGEREVYNW